MNTKHRHGTVARTELFDMVRGTTACSPAVFYGLLVWANLPRHNVQNRAGKAVIRDSPTS